MIDEICLVAMEGGRCVGEEVTHPTTSSHGSIHTKVSGCFEDWALVKPLQQKFKLLIMLLDSRAPVLPVPNSLPTHDFLYSSHYYMFRNTAMIALKSDD